MISSARIRNMIRWVKTTLPTKLGSSLPINQVQYMDKVAESVMWFPYGIHANVPAEALALMVSVQANEEAKVAFPGSPLERPTDLLPGEVAVYHPTLGTSIVLRNTGAVEVTGTVINLTGAVTVTGALTVTGAAVLSSTVTSGGTDISDTHTHPVTTAPGTTGTPN